MVDIPHLTPHRPFAKSLVTQSQGGPRTPDLSEGRIVAIAALENWRIEAHKLSGGPLRKALYDAAFLAGQAIAMRFVERSEVYSKLWEPAFRVGMVPQREAEGIADQGLAAGIENVADATHDPIARTGKYRHLKPWTSADGDNPPPKSPGRPRKNVKAAEKQEEDGWIGETGKSCAKY